VPEKIFHIKTSDIKGNTGLVNPQDLSELGAKEGDEVELYTSSRAWSVKIKSDASVPRGEIITSKDVLRRLDVEDGNEVRVYWAPPVIEEKYEPPP
jgi:anaerobic selenocysteine-containing dehydrogenase